MNIFILDKDPIKAAQYHCDKHVPKLVVELYQQMGSAVIRHGAQPHQMPLNKQGQPLKGGYHNHPCTRWVGDSRSNYQWAGTHAIGLCLEYNTRYDKIHFCEAGIRHLQEMDYFIPEGELTSFALAMPDQYKSEDPVQSYRNYYLGEKKYFAKWKQGNIPQWWIV